MRRNNMDEDLEKMKKKLGEKMKKNAKNEK